MGEGVRAGSSVVGDLPTLQLARGLRQHSLALGFADLDGRAWLGTGRQPHVVEARLIVALGLQGEDLIACRAIDLDLDRNGRRERPHHLEQRRRAFPA